jgi:hypothetical protein
MIPNTKSQSEVRFDKTITSWQGLESGNITLTDELDFDVSELDPILNEGVSDSS